MPYFDSYLSDKYPIIGVKTASVIYMRNIIAPAHLAGFLLSTTTTSTIKNRKKLYPCEAAISFKTCPIAYPQNVFSVRSSYLSSSSLNV